MKKILESTPETREYLESLPIVRMYDDCNGTCDRYFLRKLTDTTTGWIYA